MAASSSSLHGAVADTREELAVYGRMSLLSNKAIRRHMQAGSVVIEPFNEDNLATSSYDVTLGPYFYREAPPEAGMGIYNPFSASMVERVWGKPLLAETAGSFTARTGCVRSLARSSRLACTTDSWTRCCGLLSVKLENIRDDDRIIFVAPGETILGHTNEVCCCCCCCVVRCSHADRPRSSLEVATR